MVGIPPNTTGRRTTYMKTLATLFLSLSLFALAAPVSAQSNRGLLERILDRVDTSEQDSAATSTATTTAPTATSTPTPVPQPEPEPEEIPTPDPVPVPEEEEDPTPLPAPTTTPESPERNDGESADPAVLTAQQNEPTAGAGSVYRGNTLSTDMTYTLLTIAFICGVAGLILSAPPRRTRGFLPQPLTSA